MNLPKLKGKMAEKNFTQRKLANALGCSENTIGKKLKGEGVFDCYEAQLICDILDIKNVEERAEIFLNM